MTKKSGERLTLVEMVEVMIHHQTGEKQRRFLD